eukprot:6208454-Pleurochrysis_carterae.AAC.2
MLCFRPPPSTSALLTQSDEMPRTRRVFGGSLANAPRNLRGAGRAASAAASDSDGSHGGWPESPSAGCAIESDGCAALRHGKSVSSKYTSDEITTHPELGTHTWYAPGERTLLRKFIPTQTLGSIPAFKKATLGFTAKARHPNGSMLIMRSFSPVSSSNDNALVLGGPLV